MAVTYITDLPVGQHVVYDDVAWVLDAVITTSTGSDWAALRGDEGTEFFDYETVLSNGLFFRTRDAALKSVRGEPCDE